MNEQILDDFKENNEPVEYPISRYRLIGLLRIPIIALSIFLVSNNFSDAMRSFQEEDAPWFFIFFASLVNLFFLFSSFYHLRQGWAELRLNTGFAKKKLFRGFAIASSILFIVIIVCAFLYQVVTNLSELTEERIFKTIGNVIGAFIALGIFVPVLRMDRSY